MKTVRPGSLRHIVKVLQPISNPDSRGDDIITYDEAGATDEYVAIEPLYGRELQFASNIHGNVTHRVTMRSRNDITFRTKLRWEDDSGKLREFSLATAIDQDLRHILSKYYAVEIV